MKIAILGLGTVGFGVYDIIKKSEYLNDIEVKYVLDKDLSRQEYVSNETKVVNDYDLILNDEEVSLVVETMGAKGFSYECTKKALLKGKSVVTANKEMIAENITELTEIKTEKNVSLYYEASVGGGIPIIYPLFQASKVNEIDKIKGILNGTTNFILTRMSQDNYTFADALKLAQEKGFAEADPTADLEGLDMVRKIAILSSIAYKGEIDLEKIYHFGISNLDKADIDFIKEKGYALKLIASSTKYGDKVDIRIEPSLVSSDNVIAMTNNEFNIVSVNCSYNGELMFYGKGAGRYPTANAIVNDIIMHVENDNSYSFCNYNKIEVEESDSKASYSIRVKDIKLVSSEIIEKVEGNKIITKEIRRKEFKELLSNIEFYGIII